jgi:hypothetical protein
VLEVTGWGVDRLNITQYASNTIEAQKEQFQRWVGATHGTKDCKC